MAYISDSFEKWEEKLKDLQSSVEKELEEIRLCKEEAQEAKNSLAEILGKTTRLVPGQYIQDNHRIILSAPEIIIGNVDKDGVLWNMPSKVIIRANDLNLEASGTGSLTGGNITSRAASIHTIAEDPGRDGTEHVVSAMSEVVTQAKAISLNCEDTDGLFTTPASASMTGIELKSESGINLSATRSNKFKKDRLKAQADSIKKSIKELKSRADSKKKDVEARMKELNDLLDTDKNMAKNQISLRTNYLDLDDLYVALNNISASLYFSMAEYFASLSDLAEANRQQTCIENMEKKVDKEKSAFEEKSTGTFIRLESEDISALSVDGDGNYRKNPEAGVSITARNVSIASVLADGSLQKDGAVSLAAQKVDISTINPKVERNDKGEITKGDYPAMGDVRIASKNIVLESVDYEWKDKKVQEKALTKDGSLTVRVEKTELSATETEGKATGRVEVNAKKVEIKSVDVDKEKRTEKSLATGSSMLLLSEKMFVGSRDSKTRSKQLQMVSDKTAILADTTLELQQDKAVVQLSGGNASVGGGNLDLYGKTTLQAEVTAKGAIKGGDLEVKNMNVKSSFKSPCTSEGVAVPGAPATGKLNAKLKEEELKAEEKK